MVEKINPEKDFPGCVYFIPDSWLTFESTASEHPGVCYDAHLTVALIIHGTDSTHRYHWKKMGAVIVNPTSRNGLSKETAFLMELPLKVKFTRLANLHLPDNESGKSRKIGRLDEKDLAEIKRKMILLFPNSME